MKRAFFKRINDGTPVVQIDLPTPTAGANWYRNNPEYVEITEAEYDRLSAERLREIYPDA